MAKTTSRSQKLHERLGRIIANTKPGERLVTEPELARQLGVSRATLREAMRTFETQGLIRRKQGSGTFVIHPLHVIESGLEVLESLDTLARRIGLEVKTGELQVETRLAKKDEAEALGLKPDEKIVSVSRKIEAENRPVAFLVDTLPQDVLQPDEIEKGFTGSVLDLLLRRGTPSLAYSRTEITADVASAELARSMGIQRGDVLLRFTAFLFDDQGRVIDYSFSYFLPGYFKFHVIRRIG